MATVPSSPTLPSEGDLPAPAAGAAAPPKKSRRKTSHLKLVPETRKQREELRIKCHEVAARLDKSRPLTKDEMEALARRTLAEVGLPEGYVGWMMVMLATAFWHEQVAAVPYNRRLFLLPHCLKHAEGCPADYDQFGLDCKTCGACSIADFRTRAEDLGYKVLVAEGSPIVLKIIVSGHVDAIVGVACLNVLEKAIDKILLAGIPCAAVPLLSDDCRNTSVDEEWVSEMIEIPHQTPTSHTRSYLPLLRTAAGMFEPAELERLVPRIRGKKSPEGNAAPNAPPRALDPISGTESIAYDFLAQGGKHLRPFATLATYDALTGGNATGAEGAAHVAAFSDAIRRTAMSIEVFHKASLVHDDIEDDDQYRYGAETLHRTHGIPTAINVGDYLIGMGYRLVSRDAAALGPDACADILDKLAESHTRLSEGQGAELLWRDASDKQLKPLDALKIYALKTSPAFEAALYSGARLAGAVDKLAEPIAAFSRHLGVAFQILNDLKDWHGDDDNKLVAAGDVLGGRPTVLWALALEGLDDRGRAELLGLVGAAERTADGVARVRALYTQAGVFDKAQRLVDKYQEKAEGVADELEPEELRRLFYYLVDTVLDRAGTEPVAPAMHTLSLPIAPRP